jgi:hypothetical protein
MRRTVVGSFSVSGLRIAAKGSTWPEMGRVLPIAWGGRGHDGTGPAVYSGDGRLSGSRGPATGESGGMRFSAANIPETRRSRTTFCLAQEISIFQLSQTVFEKGWFRTTYPGVETFFDPGVIFCAQL